MLSGGLDSTYMLYHYLKHTQYNLHVHHISLRNPSEKRWVQEDAATKHIIKYLLRRHRKFQYSESMIKVTNIGGVWDYEIYMLMAMTVARKICNKNYVAVAVGRNLDDLERFDSFNQFGIDNVKAISDYWDAMLSFCTMEMRKKIHPKVLYPIVNISKKDILKACPKKLKDLTWSCREAVPNIKTKQLEACGECHSCLQIKNS